MSGVLLGFSVFMDILWLMMFSFWLDESLLEQVLYILSFAVVLYKV